MVGVGFKLASITVDARAWAAFVAASHSAGSSASEQVRRFVVVQLPVLERAASRLAVKDAATETRAPARTPVAANPDQVWDGPAKQRFVEAP